jgi:hypothetical protein
MRTPRHLTNSFRREHDDETHDTAWRGLLTGSGGAGAGGRAAHIVFTSIRARNTFWQAVQKASRTAAVGATCQMVYVQTDGSIQEQVANMEAALPDPDASSPRSWTTRPSTT